MRHSFTKLFLLLILFAAAFTARAQETTATLLGVLLDENNKPIQDATVFVKHIPTGTIAGTQTSAKGQFMIPNLKPGGPYLIKFTYIGYKEVAMDGVMLSLGENPSLKIKMESGSSTLSEVKITGTRNRPDGTNIDRNQLATLPTLGRSLSDFTRLTPQSNNNSFAGSSFRYNNITMDGAINNDAIGFSNSFGGQSGGGQAGTAGAGTRTSPYSLDAIQEVQVQLAPYDVKLGNFTGGSVNAVTKSGTNDFHGSAYFYGRNSSMVGNSPDASKQKMASSFYDYQYGASLGGAIIKDKLFFFVNGEITRRNEPTFYNAGDQGSAITVAQAQQITDYMKTKYGYDPGSYNRTTISTNSNKFFGRVDWNINRNNTLMFRTIYTEGSGQNLERTTTNFQFGSTDFTQHTKNLNMVAELKSTIKPKLYNSAIVSFINVHEYRDFPGQLAPFIDIGGGQIWLGTWREASVYNMKQRTLEFTDNVTWIKGINKFTFGTHNEFYHINYGFINSWNGRWEYASVNDFLNDRPSRIRGAYTMDPALNTRQNLYDNTPGSAFNVNLLSGYAQDEVTVTNNFKITAGLRVDYASVPNQPALDSNVKATQDYIAANGISSYSHTSWGSFNNQWLGKATLSPRLGFNFDVHGDKKWIVRGGTGIFVGRMPFAWLGYAYTLSGSNFGNIDYNNIQKGGTKTVGLAIDPNHLQDSVLKYGGTAAASTHEVDIVDNNFHLPTAWRSNIATDIKFGHGFKLTLDVLYTKTIYDVKFQQINVKDTFTNLSSGPTETPVYVGGKVNKTFSNVYLLTNTTEGYRYNFTVQLSKEFTQLKAGSHPMNAYAMVAYTYGLSKDLSNGIRNSFQSNYEVNPAVNPENPSLAYSNFDLRHRIVAMVTTGFNWNKMNKTSVALFYSGASGSPYSVIYNGSNPYGNASNANLIYIPKDQSDINLVDGKNADGSAYTAAQQWNDLNSFIEGDKYLSKHRGEYAQRNALRTPWNHNLDMKIMHEFRFNVNEKRQNSIQLSLDIFNVLNLISNSAGRQYFVTNVNNYTVNLLKTATDSKGVAPGAYNWTPTYTYNKAPYNGQYYTVDPITSRWQMQLGIKYNF